MPTGYVQSIENVVQNKLFFSDISQIYKLIEQGTVIRLALQRSQGIVDAIQELSRLGQPFQTKLKATILHTDFCIDPAQNSIELLQREIELSGDGFQLTVGLPENVSVVREKEKRIVICLLALFSSTCCGVMLSSARIPRSRRKERTASSFEAVEGKAFLVIGKKLL